MKPDVLKDLSHVEGSMLVISVYGIFGPLLLMIYILVFTIILIKDHEIESRPIL